MATNQAKYSSSSMEQRKILAKDWFDRHINVEELFACAICHNTIDIDHPIHCPECSKLFCGDCIDTWLSSRPVECNVQRCPCCQMEVDEHNFVYCRVYQDVHDVIARVRNNLDELIHLVNQPIKTCGTHGKELALFCALCNECICLKCLLSPVHRAHIDEVLELEDARERFQATIDREHLFLSDRLTSLGKAGEQIAADECDIMDTSESIVEEIKWATETIIDKLKDGIKERYKQHVEPVKAVTMQQRDEVVNVMKKTYELAKEETSPEVVMETFRMADEIKKMHNEPLPVIQLPDVNFVNPITPPYVEVHFLIRGFSQKLNIYGSILSNEQVVEGFTLQLKSQHDKDENENRIITLSLRVVDGHDTHDVKVICYPAKGVSAEPLVRIMDLNLNQDNTVLEFPDFQTMEGFWTASTDILNVRMKLRLWATYYDKCVHKDWYITKLAGIKREVVETHRARQ